ncbi:MAG: hypothetical protein IAE67_09995, partial [Candidatus Competibacteraceae bacterium]|nr:hypothetical protein [Candidatus Competibacteraceae bacterium]
MKKILILFMLVWGVSQAYAQCPYDNIPYSTSPAPTALGVPVTLTTCIYGGEYRTVTGLVAGATYRFETCGNTNFDTQISIYAAGGGPALGYNDDACGLQSSIDFVAPTSGDYDILIDEFYCLSNTTCMTLTATLISMPSVPNDDCVNAIILSCNSTVTGSTALATADAIPTCDGSPGAPGVWYRFTGTGQNMIASLCGSLYDTRIAVYEGTCPALVCVIGNDDFCGLQSQVSFMANNGTVYYIFVNGWGGNTGDYTLTLSPDVSNDICSSAQLITPGTYTGSTVCTGNDVAPTCFTTDGSGGGVWYRLTGTGNSFTASTCNPGTNFDTKIRVYSGNCASLNCVTGNDDDGSCGFSGLFSTVNFCTSSGVDYYILVHGFSSSEGNFELSLTENPSVPVADVSIPGTMEITIISLNSLDDEVYWEFRDASSTILASGGPYSTFTYGVIDVQGGIPSVNGPFSFYGQTTGSWADNEFAYEVRCNNALISTGTILGGQTITFPGISGCSGPAPVNAECNATLTPPTATDDCDGTITGATLDPTTYTSQGSYAVVWTYTDAAGNAASQIQAVNINDVTAPVADVSNIDVSSECSVTLTA